VASGRALIVLMNGRWTIEGLGCRHLLSARDSWDEYTRKFIDEHYAIAVVSVEQASRDG
jgi:hypothetical protein